MYALAIEEGYPANDIGIYIQPQNCGTSYHLEFTLPYCARVRGRNQENKGVVRQGQ